MDLVSIVLDIKTSLLPLIDSIVSIGKGLAGIGAVITIAIIAINQMQGKGIDLVQIARPFLLGLVITGFGTIVILPIDTIMSSIDKGLEVALMSVSKTKNETRLKILKNNQKSEQRKDEVKEAITSVEQEEASSEISLASVLSSGNTRLRTVFYNFLKYIISGIYAAVRTLISIAALVFLSLLSILGPIAFGISLFPGFSGLPLQFITHYLQIWFWLPITRVIVFFLDSLELYFLNAELDIIQNGDNSTTAFEWYSDSFMLLVYVMGIFAFLAIPTISSWLITANASSSGYNRQIQKAAMMLIKKF